MDGVILDSMPYHERAWMQFSKNHGLEYTQEELNKHIHGKTNATIFNILFNKECTAAEAEELAQEKEALYMEKIAEDVEPLPGLIDFLEVCKEKEIPCAIATSAPPGNVDFVLEHIPIRNYFSAIVDASQVTHGKPHPEIFLTAAEKLGLAPDNCIVFEDSLLGIQAAQAAGAHVVGITSNHTIDELGHVQKHATDFTEMASLLSL